MPTPDPISADANTSSVQPDAQADSDWPQLLEQWKQARRTSLLRPQGHVYAALVVLTGIVLLGMLLDVDPKRLLPLLIAGMLGAGGTGLVLSLSWSGLPLTAAQKVLAERVEAISDTRAVGPLLELLPGANTIRERGAVQNALSHLLPRLRPDDAPALSAVQRKILHDIIKTLYNAINMRAAEYPDAYFLACLEAIEQIGDAKALVPLTHIILADAPRRAQKVARDKARQIRDTLLARSDFGSVDHIPAWLNQLPAQSTFTGARLEQVLVPMYALTRLLPRLTPADASLLTPRNRQALKHAHTMALGLVMQGDDNPSVDEAKQERLGPDFELAVLDALAQIGTGEDAAHVQTLTKDGSTAYARAVRAKAREVLPILKARREKEQIGRTLLRGASAPPMAQDQLLRAASDAPNAQDTRPNELLRVPAPAAPPPIVLPTQASEEQISVRQNQSQ